jgi:hypothetical protein
MSGPTVFGNLSDSNVAGIESALQSPAALAIVAKTAVGPSLDIEDNPTCVLVASSNPAYHC